MYLLTVWELLVDLTVRELIQYGSLSVFRRIRLKMERELKVRGSEMNPSEQRVPYMLIRILACLVPFEGSNFPFSKFVSGFVSIA